MCIYIYIYRWPVQQRRDAPDRIPGKHRPSAVVEAAPAFYSRGFSSMVRGFLLYVYMYIEYIYIVRDLLL